MIDVSNADRDPVLSDVQPGDEILIRAFVESVRVESVDVTTYGRPPQTLAGTKTVGLVFTEITKP